MECSRTLCSTQEARYSTAAKRCEEGAGVVPRSIVLTKNIRQSSCCTVLGVCCILTMQAEKVVFGCHQCNFRYAGGMYLLSVSAAQLLEPALDTPALAIADPYPIEDHFIANFIVDQV